MFTGIIEHVGKVSAIQSRDSARRLTIDLGVLAPEVRLGDSVAINGVCLTATEVRGNLVGFDAVSETLACTSLGTLSTGSRVNCELALRLGDRLGGHMVQGHVEHTGRVQEIREEPGQIWLTVGISRETEKGLLLKGSIAVDGISLTIAELAQDHFAVAIIPHTWTHTNLADRRICDVVNLETDVVGQWVRKLISDVIPGLAENPSGSSLDADLLRREGFMPPRSPPDQPSSS